VIETRSLVKIDKDIVVATSTSVTCMQAIDSNLLNMVREIEDYKREMNFLENK
jgi:hypothetical protein